MVASVSPNHSTAAGTQATEGRLCMPASSGPIADRTTGTFATSSPSGVAITTEAAKPSTARCTDVQVIDQMLPSATVDTNSSHTASGAGSWYSGQIADAHTACRLPMNSASATSGGTPAASTRRSSGRRATVGVSNASS